MEGLMCGICRAVNPPSNFCSSCGSRLCLLACSVCQYGFNVQGQRFCGRCGTPCAGIAAGVPVASAPSAPPLRVIKENTSREGRDREERVELERIRAERERLEIVEQELTRKANELARLAEKARVVKEAEERALAEKARREAEEKSREEAVRAEKERQNKIRAAAAERAAVEAKEREERERREAEERDRRAALDREERERQEALEREERERQAALERKREKQRQEKERLEREKKAEHDLFIARLSLSAAEAAEKEKVEAEARRARVEAEVAARRQERAAEEREEKLEKELRREETAARKQADAVEKRRLKKLNKEREAEEVVAREQAEREAAVAQQIAMERAAQVAEENKARRKAQSEADALEATRVRLEQKMQLEAAAEARRKILLAEQVRDEHYASLLDADLRKRKNLQMLLDFEQNHYQRLRVRPVADSEAIERAFRKLGLLLHPDKLPGKCASEASELFLRLATAKSVLCSKKRAEYDRELTDGVDKSCNEEVDPEFEARNVFYDDMVPLAPLVKIVQTGNVYEFVLLHHGGARRIQLVWQCVGLTNWKMSGIYFRREWDVRDVLGFGLFRVTLAAPNMIHGFIFFGENAAGHSPFATFLRDTPISYEQTEMAALLERDGARSEEVDAVRKLVLEGIPFPFAALCMACTHEGGLVQEVASRWKKQHKAGVCFDPPSSTDADNCSRALARLPYWAAMALLAVFGGRWWVWVLVFVAFLVFWGREGFKHLRPFRRSSWAVVVAWIALWWYDFWWPMFFVFSCTVTWFPIFEPLRLSVFHTRHWKPPLELVHLEVPSEKAEKKKKKKANGRQCK
jgi:hypothetical protein